MAATLNAEDVALLQAQQYKVLSGVATPYVVSPAGNDSNDGLSLLTALETVDAAIAKLVPDGTLYASPAAIFFSAGEHDVAMSMDGNVPIPEATDYTNLSLIGAGMEQTQLVLDDGNGGNFINAHPRVIRDLTMYVPGTGSEQNFPITCYFTADKQRSEMRNVRIVGTSDCVYFNQLTGENQIDLYDCELSSHQDVFIVSQNLVTTGKTLIVNLYRCRLVGKEYISGTPTNCLTINTPSSSYGKVVVNCYDCIIEDRIVGNQAISAVQAVGPGTEIYLWNTKIHTANGNNTDLAITISAGAKVYVDSRCSFDPTKVSGTLNYIQGGKTAATVAAGAIAENAIDATAVKADAVTKISAGVFGGTEGSRSGAGAAVADRLDKLMPTAS